MRCVYLDHAATSQTKPRSVIDAMVSYFEQSGCSPGRGGYERSLVAGRLILDARVACAELFGAPTVEQVIFTPSITYALNLAIKGLLRAGDHCIASSMEHNAITRPLHALAESRGVSTTFVPCKAQTGEIDAEAVGQAIRENTRMLVVTHGSNVSGTIMPVRALGRLAREAGLLYVLDTAQTAGLFPLDFASLHADVLAFTGHKGLLGPPGTGGCVLSKRAAEQMHPLIEGGTGSMSHSLSQPPHLPDRFESGTPNTPGLTGLQAGVSFLLATGVENVRQHTLTLTKRFLTGLASIPHIRIHGPSNTELRGPTVSITVAGHDLGELGDTLHREFGIMTRSGLHCAPMAHRTLGTYPQGTLRFSFGFFNSLEEIDYTLDVLRHTL